MSFAYDMAFVRGASRKVAMSYRPDPISVRFRLNPKGHVGSASNSGVGVEFEYFIAVSDSIPASNGASS